MAKKTAVVVDTDTGELIQKKIRTWMTNDHRESPGELNTLPSETVPGQAYSVPELIKRVASGQSIVSSYEPVYHGEDVYFPDINMMELTDKMEFIESLRSKTSELSKRYRQERSAEQRLALRRQIDAEIRAESDAKIADLNSRMEAEQKKGTNTLVN